MQRQVSNRNHLAKVTVEWDRYDVMTVEIKKKLMNPVKESVNVNQFDVVDSSFFSVFHQADLSVGHEDDWILNVLSPKYKNITHHNIDQYIHLYESYQIKQKDVRNGDYTYVSFNQHDLMNFQS